MRVKVSMQSLLAGSILSLVLVGQPWAADLPGKNLKIAVVLKTLANPYWLATQQGIEAKAKEIGATVTVQAGTDESAIDEQTNMVQTMVGQDFNCFIVAPISNSNLIQPLVTAAKKNIPIVAGDAFDNDALAAAGVKLTTYVTVRHTDAGKAVAEEMVTPRRDGKGCSDRRPGGPSGQHPEPRRVCSGAGGPKSFRNRRPIGIARRL